MKKFSSNAAAAASKCNESSGNWKRKNGVKRDNKFSCMIHWISLNVCHFMAQHKVQQDLWELIFFPSSLLSVSLLARSFERHSSSLKHVFWKIVFSIKPQCCVLFSEKEIETEQILRDNRRLVFKDYIFLL